jgi:hypothetical protein
MLNNQLGWCVGDSGAIIKTMDGIHWTELVNPDPQHRDLNDIICFDQEYVWAVGDQGLILHTSDGGTNWTVEGEGITGEMLRSVFFTSTSNGYAIGNNKTLLKFGLLTDIEEPLTQPAEFKLQPNYPNPFKETTTISWQLPEKAKVMLKVYDFTGREVKTLVDSEKTMGEHSVKFEAADLPSGIYFYQLHTNGKVETKKMIYLK